MPKRDVFFFSAAFAITALILFHGALYGAGYAPVKIAFAVLGSFLGGTSFGIFINICTRDHGLTDNNQETASGRV